MLAMANTANPYQPNSLNLAIYGQWAGVPEYQIQYDQIKCPVLNVEAGLGMGYLCDGAAKQITEGSNLSVTTIRMESYGHADLVIENSGQIWKLYIIPSIMGWCK